MKRTNVDQQMTNLEIDPVQKYGGTWHHPSNY
jgi:hypothetical protein